ncbi:MAG: cytosine/creatinine deaminase, partial [Pseudonocardiales bacterium]|nr:cytosine/creatinine deaminase [Pseudonocardiales bacterium]
TANAARVMRTPDYGIAPGAPADLVCLDAADGADAVARIAPARWGLKRGRLTFTRELPVLHQPGALA